MCTEDSPSGLWRTLGKRVGCKPSGVRIPHPPPPDPGTASGSGVFVACGAAGVLGAVGPGRLDGPGRCVCRWAAARPRAVRAASFARRVVSKPGQAPPPPTGTAARPCSPRRQASGFCGGRQSGGPALLSPGLVPLDSEALDDLCARERGQDLARHKELRSAQARADAAPSDRARRVDEEPP